MSDERGADGSLLASLVKSAALIGAAAAANAGRRAATTIIGYLFVAGLFITSLWFMTLAAHRALASAVGDVLASLIVGGAYLLAALVAALILQLRRRR
jgi:apolipoprotein N-acyltransferase